MFNPLANDDQFAAEADVAAMWQLPEIQKVRAHAGALWRLAYGEDVPDGASPCFEAAMDEFVTNYLFKAAACDPFHPRFVRDFMAAYAWSGQVVPGARMGGDNPDNCYRLAGIAHGSAYRVHGHPVACEPANVSFTLVGNWGTSVTVQTVELADFVRDADGGFIITIDDQPADGRPNHMTTTPQVKFLFVRDSMANWAIETPLALSIERLGNEAPAPLTLAQKAERAASRLTEEVPLYYWFTRLFSGRPANSMTNPAAVASIGGLVTQASSGGRLDLGPEDAAIIRYDPAGASYCGPVLYDWWFRSIDAAERQSSLTAAMSQVDNDGWVTCVACARDPGVYNWLDTGGLLHSLALIRWQELPTNPVRGGPAIDLRIVHFDQLDAELPATIARIDAAGRAKQWAARKSAYSRRIAI